jgi:peptidyl-prolyl cis-trans isomerase SurA
MTFHNETEQRMPNASVLRRCRLRPGGLLLLALALFFPANRTEAEVVNRIVATIDGEPITLYELREFVKGDPRLQQAQQMDEAMVLDTLITKHLIDREIEANGLVVTDEDIDRYIVGIREQNQISEEQLDAALAQQGMSRELYRKQVHEELLRAQLISREIRGKVNVTPEDVQRYYEAHREDYEKPSQMTVSHIVLRLPADAPASTVEAVQERAGQIHAQLMNGADFAELAHAVSEDSAARDGGKLGSFEPGDMLESLEQATQDLDPGEFSLPVRSPIGIHIVRLDDRITGGEGLADSQAEEIKQRLYNNSLEERYNRWLTEDLREDHHVEIRP